MGWGNPLGWGPKALGWGLRGEWHLAKPGLGWLAGKGAHAAGPPAVGALKWGLSQLSLTQLLAILLFIVSLVWQALMGAFPQLDRTIRSLTHPAAYNLSASCTPLPVGGLAGVGWRFGSIGYTVTHPPAYDPVAMQTRMEAEGHALGVAFGQGWAAFQSALHGGITPADPTVATLPPSQQVSAPSGCCPGLPPTIPASSTDTAPVVAAKAAITAGFTGADLLTAVEVAGAESGYLATAANPGSTARGVWQIMLSAHPGLLPGNTWADPYANARAAKVVHDNAHGWTPWVTFTDGSYLRWQAQAQQAIAKAQGVAGPFITIAAPVPAVPAALPCTAPPPAAGASFHDGTTTIILPRANPRTAVQAIDWARSMAGSTVNPVQGGNWRNDCANFVAQTYGWSSYGYTYAIDLWNRNPPALRHPGDRSPPPGALLFWNTSSMGHVALYLGGGMIATTDMPAGAVGVVPASQIEAQWHAPYLGWAAPYFPNAGGPII